MHRFQGISIFMYKLVEQIFLCGSGFDRKLAVSIVIEPSPNLISEYVGVVFTSIGIILLIYILAASAKYF